MIEIFLTAFGGTAAMLAIAAFLGKRFLDVLVSRAIEKYKSELEQRTTVLKTELSIYAHEQNIGLSRLDEQRCKSIQEIYGLVMRWHDIYLKICQPNDSHLSDTQMKIKQYHTWATSLVKEAENISVIARNSAIFYQQSSYEIISKFGMSAMELSCNFYDKTFGNVDGSKDLNPDELFPIIENQRKALSDASKEEFTQLEKTLISEFRKLMKAERSEDLTYLKRTSS